MGELASRLAGHATATALLEGDDRISYGELSERVLRTAAALRARGLPVPFSNRCCRVSEAVTPFVTLNKVGYRHTASD